MIFAIMGNHHKWRKIAKRERRRKIRTQAAQERDEIHDDEAYQKEQEMLYAFELEMIEKTNMEENAKWLHAEQIATHQWQVLQVKKSILRQQQLDKELKLQIEWEIEKQKKKAEEGRLKAIEEEKISRQENFMRNLEEFLSGDSAEPPRELLVSRETKPDAALCPFFSKTFCCRFGDNCSRNHRYPGISNVLLATNFYDHFGWNNAKPTEYDTDIMLEYEDSETYKEFKEFFYDVLQEFEKFGKIIQFKVCNNFEKHLRGNVYVEYDELRCAVAAYRALHTRWYAGRQLSLQFCLLKNWKNAICGLQFKKRCPKGRSCNYMHVFKNPNNMFVRYDTGERDNVRSPSRSWRWSESPEPETPRRSTKRDRGDRKYEGDDWEDVGTDKRKRRNDDKKYNSRREKNKRLDDTKHDDDREKRKYNVDSDDDSKYGSGKKHDKDKNKLNSSNKYEKKHKQKRRNDNRKYDEEKHKSSDDSDEGGKYGDDRNINADDTLKRKRRNDENDQERNSSLQRSKREKN